MSSPVATIETQEVRRELGRLRVLVEVQVELALALGVPISTVRKYIDRLVAESMRPVPKEEVS